jgi:hypothetical protein
MKREAMLYLTLCLGLVLLAVVLAVGLREFLWRAGTGAVSP